MRIAQPRWKTAFLAALLAHVVVAVGMLREPPESGAQNVGVGGVEVTLGATGGAPGSDAAVLSEISDAEDVAVTEAVSETPRQATAPEPEAVTQETVEPVSAETAEPVEIAEAAVVPEMPVARPIEESVAEETPEATVLEQPEVIASEALTTEAIPTELTPLPASVEPLPSESTAPPEIQVEAVPVETSTALTAVEAPPLEPVAEADIPDIVDTAPPEETPDIAVTPELPVETKLAETAEPVDTKLVETAQPVETKVVETVELAEVTDASASPPIQEAVAQDALTAPPTPQQAVPIPDAPTEVTLPPTVDTPLQPRLEPARVENAAVNVDSQAMLDTPVTPGAGPAQPTAPAPGPIQAEMAALAPSAPGVGGAGSNMDRSDTGLATDDRAGGNPGARVDYMAELQAWLEEHKEYPRRAKQRRQEGVVLLHFVMNREGWVLEHSIEESSGHNLLDREVKKMLERAQPLPPIPTDIVQAHLEIVVPVQFDLR